MNKYIQDPEQIYEKMNIIVVHTVSGAAKVDFVMCVLCANSGLTKTDARMSLTR